jgi:hypothetical protein
VTGSTLADGSAASGGGGAVDTIGGTSGLAGSIVAGSTAGGECSGTVTDAGYNLDDDSSCGFTSGAHSLSGVNPELGPLQQNGGPTETQAPALGSPVLNVIPLQTTGNGVTFCPSLDQRNDPRPWGTGCDIGAVELAGSEAITSGNSATAVVGTPFSFTVTTTGTPVPVITKQRPLPKGIKLVDNHNGTATISGKAKKAGVYNFGIKAQFENGTRPDKLKLLAGQSFTLTVNPA